MRKLMLMASMLAMVLLAASAAMAQSGVQGPACAELGDSGQQAQQAAKALLNQNPSDPNGLDANGNGIPCEFSASAGKIAYEDGSVIYDVNPGANVTPGASPQNGGTTDGQYGGQPAPQQPAPKNGGTPVLPSTGGISLLTLGTGALLLAGGLLARRIMR